MVACVYVDLPQPPVAGVDELVRHAGRHHNDLPATRLDNVVRDLINEDCENVFVAGGQKPVDEVSGNGELGPGVGSPRLRVNAKATETNSDDAQGTFSITYPGDPDVARDNTEVRGTILCMAVTGNEARLVGSGRRADRGPRTAPSWKASTCA
jgi:hypothetical protein